MKMIQRISMVAAAAAVVGCTAEMANDGFDDGVATQNHEIGVVDCQFELAECTTEARGVIARARCARQYRVCTQDAANDLLDDYEILAECRSDANDCLEGALSLQDIQACRGLFSSCAEDAIGTVDSTVDLAVDLTQDVVDQLVDGAIDAIDSVGGLTGDALGAVEACSDEATTCLQGAVSLDDVSACRSTVTVCLEEAVGVVDGVIDVLPVPSLEKVEESLDQCRADSVDCLEGALTVSDISSCRSVLESCVEGVTSVADDVAAEFDALAGDLVNVPSPGETIDCSVQLSECLLSLQSPFTCADEARECSGLI